MDPLPTELIVLILDFLPLQDCVKTREFSSLFHTIFHHFAPRKVVFRSSMEITSDIVAMFPKTKSMSFEGCDKITGNGLKNLPQTLKM